jgi:acyl carrier protein
VSTTQKTQWTPEAVEEKIAEIIVAQLDVERQKITREAKLFADLPMDSLDIVQISMECEDAFDIKLPEDSQAFQTVGDIISYVLSETTETKAE